MYHILLGIIFPCQKEGRSEDRYPNMARGHSNALGKGHKLAWTQVHQGKGYVLRHGLVTGRQMLQASTHTLKVKDLIKY